MKFVLGFFLGIVVSTVGFSGIVGTLDQAVDVVKWQAEKLSHERDQQAQPAQQSATQPQE
jgi:hypothetical protein